MLRRNISRNGDNNDHPDELEVVNLIRKAFSFIERFKMILGTCLVVGLAFGLYLYFISPPRLSTRLIVHSMILSNPEEIEIIDSWQELIKKGERSELANLMGCREDVIKKLSSISAEEILKTYTANNPNGFIINVTVTDNSILEPLQRGIINGLNNSPYVKEKIEIKKTKDKELITKTSDEIIRLNQTKQTVYNLIQTSRANTSPFILDISRVSGQIIDLNEKLFYYQEDLKFVTGIQVLDSFKKGRLSRNGLLKFAFLGMATGLFIGYLVSLFLLIRIQLKTAYTSL